MHVGFTDDIHVTADKTIPGEMYLIHDDIKSKTRSALETSSPYRYIMRLPLSDSIGARYINSSDGTNYILSDIPKAVKNLYDSKARHDLCENRLSLDYWFCDIENGELVILKSDELLMRLKQWEVAQFRPYIKGSEVSSL